MEELWFHLHGLLSSPESPKALFLTEKMESLGYELKVIDRNPSKTAFEQMTLEEQLERIQSEVKQSGVKKVSLIGSSFGAMLATLFAARNPNVQRLILLAPAFRLSGVHSSQLRKVTTQPQVKFPLEHPVYGKVTLHPSIIEGLFSGFITEDFHLRDLPILIILGKKDVVIDLDVIRRFATKRTNTRVFELESDHSLLDKLDIMASAMEDFLSSTI